MNALQDRHAFVTGAARGIGAAIASALAAAGANVTCVARHARDGVMACDVTSRTQVDATIAAAEQRRGPIHILINNAGIGISARFLKAEMKDLDAMLDVNLKGAWHCTQRALPAMLDGGWGRVVNVASISGLEGYPYISGYCASKHALVGLTRALASEHAGTGVAFAAVCPSYVNTDILTESLDNITARTGMSREEARAKIAAMNPEGRILEPEEVAAAVLDLCTRNAENSNGCILPLP